MWNDQPRDYHGRWTTGGGARAETAGRSAVASALARPNLPPSQAQGHKPGPQTQHKNLGTRAAFALRNKMIHDAGKAQRMAAAAAHQKGVHGLGKAAGPGFLAALLAGMAVAGAKGVQEKFGSKGGGRR